VSNRTAVIVNQSAGCGYDSQWLEDLAGKFRQHGLETRPKLVSGGSEILDAINQAKADGVATIVAGGGDGTVNAVASSLVGSDIRLGILPLGTLNHFAKDLGIPLPLDEAVKNIGAGHCARIDAGEVNGRIFLNNSSIGIYPDLVTVREAEQRRYGIGKWRAFFRAMVAVFRRYPFLHTQLTVDGQSADRDTPCVFVGNNEYGTSGIGIGGRKRLDAGVLSVYVVDSPKRTALFGLVVRALCGRLRQAGDFESMLARKLVIETPQASRRVSTDGEVTVMETPLNYRIRPQVLSVIVPQPSASRPDA